MSDRTATPTHGFYPTVDRARRHSLVLPPTSPSFSEVSQYSRGTEPVPDRSRNELGDSSIHSPVPSYAASAYTQDESFPPHPPPFGGEYQYFTQTSSHEGFPCPHNACACTLNPYILYLESRIGIQGAQMQNQQDQIRFLQSALDSSINNRTTIEGSLRQMKTTNRRLQKKIDDLERPEAARQIRTLQQNPNAQSILSHRPPPTIHESSSTERRSIQPTTAYPFRRPPPQFPGHSADLSQP